MERCVMPTYLHPGVYVEEVSSGSRPIEGVSTSITAFVGEAVKGPAGEATLIQSWDDYISSYGEIDSDSDAMGLAVQAFYQNGGKAAYICRVVDTDISPVAAFSHLTGEVSLADAIKISANSVGKWGEQLYYRVVKASTSQQKIDLEIGSQIDGEFKVSEIFSDLSMNPNSSQYIITQVNENSDVIQVELETLEAQYQFGAITGEQIVSANNFFTENLSDTLTMVVNINGLGAQRISLDTDALTLGGTNNADDGDAVAEEIQRLVGLISIDDEYQDFTCIYETTSDERTFILTSGVAGAVSEVEIYDGDGGESDLASILSLDSEASTITVHGAANVIPQEDLGLLEQGTALSGGVANSPGSDDYTDFFGTVLKKITDVSIITMPGETWDGAAGQANIEVAKAHCESLKSRMLIVDPASTSTLVTSNDVDSLGLPSSTYTVLYYPWVKISNPFFDKDLNPNVNKTLSIAPSAMVAGMWAKIDGNRGVWKAPAGVETQLTGVSALEADIDASDQDQLNPMGVNCIRKIPGFGSVLWGSRTLATKANPEWRYVPVRRTAIFIERSIYEAIQWAVFEPNAHPLWSSLRANIENFMNGLFRAGAFQGQKASDAFFVRCGKGDTMTQGDIDAGKVIVVIGFAPVKPAEFVIVRIQQIVGQ